MNALNAFIAQVESLRTLNERVAKEAAPEILKAAQDTAAKGETPEGEKWPELHDGGKPLQSAATAIKVSVSGNQVSLSVGPPFVYHQHGAGGHSTTKEAVRARAKAAKSGTKSKFHAPRRQILPEPGEPVPPEMKAAITEVAARVFKAT